MHGDFTRDSNAKESKQSGDLSVSTKSTKSTTKQTSITQFSHDIALTTVQACKDIQNCIYELVNDSRLPTLIVEKAHFCNLVSCMMNNAALMELKDTLMSNCTIIKMWIKSFNAFIQQVSQLGCSVQSHYKLLCGYEILLTIFCYDI